MGRPPEYKTPEEMQVAIDSYFSSCKDSGEKITVTGLAIHLGFASKQSIYDYVEKPQFSYPIKRALLMVEHSYEKQLYQNNVAGSVFALKNMGWKDKVEQEVSGKDGQPVGLTVEILRTNTYETK
jgi:hypothetical protein